MNEFEFRPDRTTDYGVSCPWASKKYPHRPYNWENGVSTFSLLFLIGSFWYFHVTRTSIKAWMSSNFLKWDLTLAHWTQVSDHCPLGYLFSIFFPLGRRKSELMRYGFLLTNSYTAKWFELVIWPHQSWYLGIRILFLKIRSERAKFLFLYKFLSTTVLWRERIFFFFFFFSYCCCCCCKVRIRRCER